MDNLLPQSAGEITTVNIPAGRDPFINTPLISVGKNRDSIERFWISSWNSNVGTIGLLVDEFGRERIYRFAPPHHGFYSAVAEDENTLWLCGDLSCVVRLDLESGEYQSYETGAASALVFSGMILDNINCKLFALAYPPGKTTAFSFDYAACKSIKIYEDVYESTSIIPDQQAYYSRVNFANGDGTYSLLVVTPGVNLLRWNPLDETISVQTIASINPDKWQRKKKILTQQWRSDSHFINNVKGEFYFPNYGWYNPLSNSIADGPAPQREMNWFARRGGFCWGTSTDTNSSTIMQWDMTTGDVKDICVLNDHKNAGMILSENNKIISVSIYGDFRRHDAYSGALEISKRLPTDSIGAVDCLCRIDENRLLGTPFITQRFWEVNLKTGHGYDCGRASSGVGEVLLTWNINGKVYMASYTKGELTEYDPNIHPRFPENPRLVAKSPHGMRPISGTRNGDILYYASSHHYGHLGGEITKYDTVTGEAFYRDNPLTDLCMTTLHFHEPSQRIITGSTIHADCRSCPPKAKSSVLAILDIDKLEVLQTVQFEGNPWQTLIYGQLDKSTFLVQTQHDEAPPRWWIFDEQTQQQTALNDVALTNPQYLKYTGIAGLFIAKTSEQFELWNLREMQYVKQLHPSVGVHHCMVQDETVYLTTQHEIIVLENCLND